MTPSRPPDAAAAPPSPALPKPSRLAAMFADLDADPRYAWTTRRRNRLVLVGTQATLLATALVLLSLDRPVLALLAVCTFFPLMSLINIGIHGLLEIPVAHLDEVMSRVRTEAKAQAYTSLVVLMGVLIVVLPLGAMVAVERFAEDPRAAVLVSASVAVGLFAVALLLPRWILAWRLPDQSEVDVASIPPSAAVEPATADHPTDHVIDHVIDRDVDDHTGTEHDRQR